MIMAPNKLVLRAKIIVLGDAGVGKSGLTQVFHSDGTHFPKNYSMTVHNETCVKSVNIPETDATVELYIFDLAGHDLFQEYVSKYSANAASFAILYDVSNAETFKSTLQWLQVAKKSRPGRSIPGVLIANKVDVGERRQVLASQGEELARSNGMEYFETSAMNNTDVEGPFYFLANAFYRSYEETVQGFGNAVGVSK